MGIYCRYNADRDVPERRTELSALWAYIVHITVSSAIYAQRALAVFGDGEKPKGRKAIYAQRALAVKGLWAIYAQRGPFFLALPFGDARRRFALSLPTKWDKARRPLSCYAPLWGRMQSKRDVIYCTNLLQPSGHIVSKGQG